MIGPRLNLTHSQDWCMFLLSCVQVYRLLTAVSQHLPPQQGCLALYMYKILGFGDGKYGAVQQSYHHHCSAFRRMAHTSVMIYLAYMYISSSML